MNHRVKGVTTSSHITVAATASLIVSSLRMWFNPWKLAYGDANTLLTVYVRYCTQSQFPSDEFIKT